MKNSLIYLLFPLFILLLGCSNDDDTAVAPVTTNPTHLKGTLFFDWATEGTLAFNTETAIKREFLSYNSKRNNWDISRDNEILLTVSKNEISSDVMTFTMSKMSDGSIANQFEYTPLNGGSAFNSGKLSPDKSLVAVMPTFREGLVLLKTDGTVVAHLEDVNGEKLDRSEQVQWLPDNGILLTHKNYIIKIAPPYTSGSLVKEMNFEDWGDMGVNQQGTKIAVRVTNHIHMMNIDGSDFVQVTESNSKEAYPTFSPDGKYLLIGTDYKPVAPMGAIWYLKIIPADGKKYNVSNDSEGVIPVMIDRNNSLQTASGAMLWR
ncbi:hypothetical protein FVR03_05025 [Pontibacter qinzhouensis]|uniref:WD40 repeat domain-containing protein n=1 Tax=Pontibacter qinzhouensis TaxID=2603253 RepID=A0A5C8K8Y8_9BACT|nr:hypothetical protein [Pontibacter qinzhouensis]TXK50262.1 hypothetical protein FVR03_05025 [Pontibacter qinzhouensis]